MAESDVSDLPPASEVLNALGALREPLLKVKVRDLAVELWPQHERYIRMSAEQFDREATDAANASGAAPSAGQPTAEETIGIKWADAIECFVDEDATDSQVSEILTSGRQQVYKRIGGLQHRFANLLSDDRLRELNMTIQGMTRLENALTDFVDSGGNGRFATIEEQTSEEAWEGEDGKKAREQYGQTVRVAAGSHLGMAGYLTEASAAALTQECRVYTELGSAVNEAGDRVEQLTSVPPVKVPLLKSIGYAVGTVSLIVSFSGPIGWTVTASGFAAGAVSEKWDVDIPLSSAIERIMTEEEADGILDALDLAVDDAETVYDEVVGEAGSELESKFVQYGNYKSNVNLVPGQGY